ncbi:MAG: rod shape-determining protein MreD [Candidatus Theseobacter exili]|nr:rod shape-determining protein MreD [Candidatus Theseobacter exili]
MKLFIWLFLVLFSIVFQTSVFNRLEIFGAKPDLLLILIVYANLDKKIYKGLSFALIGGIFADGFSGTIFGIQLICKQVDAFITQFLSRRLFINEKFVKILIIAIVSLVDRIVLYSISVLLNQNMDTFLYLAKNTVVIVLYNVMVSIVLFKVFDYVFSLGDRIYKTCYAIKKKLRD